MILFGFTYEKNNSNIVINKVLKFFLDSLFDQIKALLSYSCDELRQITTENGNTVVHMAIESSHLKLLVTIKSICPDLFKIRNNEGFTAAGLACKMGKLKLLQWIIIHFPEGEKENEQYPSVMELSVIFNQSNCCLWLCSEVSRKVKLFILSRVISKKY